VASAAAVLQEGDPNLKVWPEEVKAILMASAFHNVEGSARLSDIDGAGGMEAWQALRIVIHPSNKRNSGNTTYYCPVGSWTTLTSFFAPAGTVVRAVIAWDTDPSYASYVTQPSSDLDLRVTNVPGGGTFSVYSSSNDNTYEIVEFTAPGGGIALDLQVDDWRCSEPSGYTFLGWAYTRR
jgi:hypothetical protein